MNIKLNPRAIELIFVFNKHKLQILKELFDCKDDICGCDLVEKIGISKDLLSYHVKTLKEKGYVEAVKCGRNKKYVISPKKYDLVKKILKLAQLI